MKIVTPKQMKMIEERSEKVGVSRKKLMENAGKALAEIIDSYCHRVSDAPPEEKSIVFLAGKGNNGGDCFAAAGNLVYRGYRITISNIGGKPSTPLSKEMYLRLPNSVVVNPHSFASSTTFSRYSSISLPEVKSSSASYPHISPRSIPS